MSTDILCAQFNRNRTNKLVLFNNLERVLHLTTIQSNGISGKELDLGNLLANHIDELYFRINHLAHRALSVIIQTEEGIALIGFGSLSNGQRFGLKGKCQHGYSE